MVKVGHYKKECRISSHRYVDPKSTKKKKNKNKKKKKKNAENIQNPVVYPALDTPLL